MKKEEALKKFTEYVHEKITLQYHHTLNQKLFDGDILREEVRHKLLEVALAWQKFSKIPEDLIHDVILTGGNANYNYTKYSDLDIHLIMDKYELFNNASYVDEFLADKKSMWASTRNIKIKGYTVEMYAQDVSDHLVASGVYSLRDNKWIIKPKLGDYNFKNDEALEKKADEVESTVDKMIKDCDSKEAFGIMKDKIKNMRKAALSAGDEYSFENLVFKEIRNRGVLDRMNKYLQSQKDKDLSLD